MRKTLTTKAARALRPRPKAYTVSDPELRGHYVRIHPSGARAYTVITRDPAGRQKWVVVGDAAVLEIGAAREKARAAIARVRDGLPAFEISEESFEAVARRWQQRHVKVNKLRTEKRIDQMLHLHVFDFWKGRSFLSIRRSDVAALLDDIEDGHGASQADNVLGVLSSMANWFAGRNDDYRPPFTRGMRRYNIKQNARRRILKDGEICAFWKATELGIPFHGFARFALLTAQRKAKVATLRWDDITADGEWLIRQEPREKSSAGSLVLPPLALKIVEAQPRVGDNPYVFPGGRGTGPIQDWGYVKRALDARLPGDFEPWTIHDLRRTARSLMSRADVPPDHAERTLGHTIAGVHGVYDRHTYRDEKAAALRALAGLIENITDPRPNVVVMRGAKRK